MLAQIHPFIAAEVAYRRERIAASVPRRTESFDDAPEVQARSSRHLVPGVVRRALSAH